MTAELVPANTSPVAAIPNRPLVHDEVRRQLHTEIGETRIAALNQLVDGATFNEVLHWLSSSRRASVDTKRGYADDLAKIATWAAEHFGHAPVPLLATLDANAVTVWSVYVRSQGWAVRRHRRALSALSSLFTYAGLHGWPVTNPVNFEDHALPVGTSYNDRPVGATRVIERDEVNRMESACRTTEEQVVFDLLRLEGLRESEVAFIRAEHVDRNYSPVVLKVRRKRGKWLDRPLRPRTEASINAHLAGREEGALLLDPKTGEPRTRHQIIDITRRLARRAGIPNPSTVTPHVLRATAITDLLDAGVPLQDVQKWAGHASSKTTQGYWERRNSGRRDAELSAVLEAMLGSDG